MSSTSSRDPIKGVCVPGSSRTQVSLLSAPSDPSSTACFVEMRGIPGIQDCFLFPFLIVTLPSGTGTKVDWCRCTLFETAESCCPPSKEGLPPSEILVFFNVGYSISLFSDAAFASDSDAIFASRTYSSFMSFWAFLSCLNFILNFIFSLASKTVLIVAKDTAFPNLGVCACGCVSGLSAAFLFWPTTCCSAKLGAVGGVQSLSSATAFSSPAPHDVPFSVPAK
mmetsp:Transcript_17447/g.23520  ORF Transcript_17447/g.23520 Transcript_17447/m.23520 type:complete len:224 (+) Transcript_17447:1232-1903(+)